MKLSKLLLSSAALVVAGSAYAADLPAKKGAPAAKAAATGCPAFGAGFFAIPGGDSCIKLSGYVRTQPNLFVTSDTRKHDLTGTGNLVVDARNNSDLGTIRSVLDTNLGGTLNYAYLQVGGITMGKAASATSFNLSGVGYGLHSDVTADQVTYGGSVGSTTFSIGLEDSRLTGSIASRPDVVAKIKTTMGALNLTAAAVSAETRASDSASGAASNGYALLGKADATLGSVGVAVYGAYAQGASQYARNVSYSTAGDENTAGTLSTTQSAGLQLSAAAGPGTVYVYAGQSSGTSGAGAKTTTTEYALSYKQDLAQGLYVRPEVVSGTTDGSTTNEFWFRVQRDF